MPTINISETLPKFIADLIIISKGAVRDVQMTIWLDVREFESTIKMLRDAQENAIFGAAVIQAEYDFHLGLLTVTVSP